MGRKGTGTALRRNAPDDSPRSSHLDQTVLEEFGPATRTWFREAFDSPTAAQAQAWRAIRRGDDTLVVAPTGSGKTLAAFLTAIDRLTHDPDGVPGEPRTPVTTGAPGTDAAAGADARRTARVSGRAQGVDHDEYVRVLYISPLKALAADVDRNLRRPLRGIAAVAKRSGDGLPGSASRTTRGDLRDPEDAGDPRDPHDAGDLRDPEDAGDPRDPHDAGEIRQVTVGVRTGDTPPEERRRLAKHAPDILITTPESLFLLLTSAARESLARVEMVIIDEIHSLAGTKRGAHLAVSLERLDAAMHAPAQRIGLSATVRPLEEVGRYLTGGRPVTIVRPPSAKSWDLRVVVPIEDMGALGQVTQDLSGPAAGDPRRTSIWPHVEERLVDLIAEHRATLVFANSRRLAERITTRINEIWDERNSLEAADPPSRWSPPAELIGASGTSSGRAHADAPVLARAHHGSVSREQRSDIEEALKAGRLPAVVATSSLELGIDMGEIDLVAQVEAPPSVASGLQRVGRAGHQVGALSRGVFFPKYRGDLVQTAVVAERMRAGLIEAVEVPATPLDVLAQQVVAMCAMDEWPVDEMLSLMRRTASFAALSRAVLESVLDMLAGRYPSEEFAELRPRLVWDRAADTLIGRPGAQRLAVTSGGTIPDRGLFGVFLAGEGPGRRVGELDEEMVYESRVGDVFTLGTSSWRILEITHDRVIVAPAPGEPGRLPFWKGDTIGRAAELGAAVGAFVREVATLSEPSARERLQEAGLDDWAIGNLRAYLAEQHEATGALPSDTTVVIERFRDELGDWRIVLHSPYGSRVHAPWALAVSARLRERFGFDVQAMHGDDGIVLRLPDVELSDDTGSAFLGELADIVTLDPDDLTELVTASIGGSALFASRFRECAGRALLLPRRRPDQRSALWQQRQRSAQLLQVASQYPAFPIVLEAVRECLQDVFDVPALTSLMRDIAARRVRLLTVDTETPSPFARSLLFGYVAQFLYEGDSPLAERRAAALALDPSLLAELLGAEATLRELLEPEVVRRTESELQHLVPARFARHAEDVVDLLRRIGPLSAGEVRSRTREESRNSVDEWLGDLVTARRAMQVSIAGDTRWAVVEDAGRLLDGLGAALPSWVPEQLTSAVADPLADLVARYARSHGPFTGPEVARRLGIGEAVAREALRRLTSSGRVVAGDLRPEDLGGPRVRTAGPDFCDAQVLRLLRRRSLASLRAQVEPVTGRDLARFLPTWQGIADESSHLRPAMRGLDGLLRVIEQLDGARVPASALESLVLPARVAGYSPSMLDELLASGAVVWQGRGGLAADDGWISLHPSDTAHLTLEPPGGAATDEVNAVLQRHLVHAMRGGGGYFFHHLLDTVRRPPGNEGDPAPGEDPTAGDSDEISPKALEEALWEAVWAGQITNDTFAPVRALLAGGRGAHRTSRRPPSRSARPGRMGRLGRLGGLGLPSRSPQASEAARSGSARVAGRWSLIEGVETDPTARAMAAAEVLLERHGVLTRGAVTAEDVSGGFAAMYRVLAAAEEAGAVRRGYLVEHLGASQFATAGAIDRLRALSRPLEDTAPRPEVTPPVTPASRRETAAATLEALVLAATDPANPYGAALPWPASTGQGAGAEGRGHRPARKAGALVVLAEGRLVFYVERGGRSLLTFAPAGSEISGVTKTTGAMHPPAAPAPAHHEGALSAGEMQAAATALATTVQRGAVGPLTVTSIDGAPALGSDHPAALALTHAGFHAMTRGLRFRHA